MKFIITKMSFINLSTTFKMKRLKKLHLLVVKYGYNEETDQFYTKVFVDDVLVQKFEG